MSDERTPTPAFFERQELAEGLRLLKDWAIWLVTIQTAAIAAMGALIGNAENVTVPQKAFACLTVGSFALSIAFATFLLVSLPAFYLRNRSLPIDADPILRSAFDGSARIRRIRLLDLIGGEQYLFLSGICFFVLFVMARVLGEATAA